MIPPHAVGGMTEAKAEHLSFDILEQKKLKLEKMDKKKEKKKRRKQVGSKVCSEKHDWSAMTFAG